MIYFTSTLPNRQSNSPRALLSYGQRTSIPEYSTIGPYDNLTTTIEGSS